MRLVVAASVLALVGCTVRPEGTLVVPSLTVPAEDLARHHVEGVAFALSVPAEADAPAEPSETKLLLRAD